MKKIILTGLITISATLALATDLPIIKRQQANQDWLINPAPYKARIGLRENGSGLVLDNGLVRREFLLKPNLACISYENLTSMQQCLRAVEPEAEVTIDGKKYAVGGLIGQPHKAYLLPAWLPLLKNDPKSFQLSGFEIVPVSERLKWKRVRHCAPDAVWPPKGVAVRFDFRAPAPAARHYADFHSVLMRDPLDQARPGWRKYISKSHPRSSIDNEGKFGEIYTPRDSAAYIERDLPAGTEGVEVQISRGSDTSAQWGPGLALVFPSRTVRLNVIGSTKAKPRVGFFDGSRHHKPVTLKSEKPVTLRFTANGNQWEAQAKIEGGNWRTIGTFTCSEAPKSVRIGKMDARGGAKDAAKPGPLVRCRINDLVVYGGKAKQAERPLDAVTISVHYEIYDGIPVIMKWITIHNAGKSSIELNHFTSEIISAVEPGEHTSMRPEVQPLRHPEDLHVETDYMFGSQQLEQARRDSVHWVADPAYRTQHQWRPNIPCLLRVEPTIGPDQIIKPGKTFTSFHCFELSHDSKCRERRGLAVRKMYRTLAPWVTENPLILHVVSSREAVVRNAINQAAECGFEMVSMSFGSGFSFEKDNPAYTAKWKKMTDYAHSKGIELGAYSLLASRRVGGGNDVVPPPASSGLAKTWFGHSPALASKWGQNYFRKLTAFFNESGFTQFTHDGSYPGDYDNKARPPLQRGLKDSQWVQWRIISDFYAFLLANGIYNRVPDYYFMSGAGVCPMGYRELNWSLPREDQLLLTRISIYDNTWRKTPTMGFTFVPLSNYHGGGPAARIEPLSQHIDHYRRILRTNLAMGVETVYRGPRLYDTPAVRDMVINEIKWFKKYRDILESDLIHGRRTDGRDIDWMLHVNPKLKRKGMLVVFNPLDKTVERTIKVNLHYTGLSGKASVREQDRQTQTVSLDGCGNTEIKVSIPANEMNWYLIE